MRAGALQSEGLDRRLWPWTNYSTFQGLAFLSRRGLSHLGLLGKGRIKWSMPAQVLHLVLCLEHKEYPVTVTAIIMRMALVFIQVSTCDTVFIKGERQQEGKAPVWFYSENCASCPHLRTTPDTRMRFLPPGSLTGMHVWSSSGLRSPRAVSGSGRL